MGLIEDKNGKPLSDDKEQSGDDNGKSNGARASGGVMDVRTVPTGTLIYNLCLVTNREDGAFAMLQQLEQMKVTQKVVGDPPQLVAMHAEYQLLQEARYGMAAELNFRFKAMDIHRAKTLGVEIFEPGSLAEEPASDPG